MFKLKTLLAAALAAVTLNSFACWFTSDNFNGNYIAGVNNYTAHYTQVDGIANATYYNGQTVDLPLTVFVKVSPRYPDQSGESSGEKPIVKAVLQYKVLPSGAWITVRTIENVSWKMDWDHPVALFGRNSISGLAAGTEILIRLYLSDGTYETGDLGTDITSTVPATATQASGATYQGGWTAPFVFRVKVSGKVRPAR